MGVTRWAGATWCDVTSDGRIVAVVGAEVQAWPLGGAASVVAYAPEPLGWLRAEVTSRGALACVAQGQSGAGWLWRLGSWVNLGQTYGVSPLEVVGAGAGWRVWMQTAADRYDLLTVASDGEVLSRVAYAMPATSQGFLDATDDRLLFTDAGRMIGFVVLPNRAGDSLVGQDPTRDQLVLATVAGTPLRVLSDGPPVREPRGAWVNGEIVAASRSDDGGAVVVRGRPEDFPVWTPSVVTPPEPPTPPVEPPTGGDMLETLQRLRSAYGPTMTDDECVALCNDAAWVHRSGGYGVSKKESGTRGTRYDGQQCCHDVVMLRDGRYWDVLAQAGGASVPQWQTQPNGVITDPARGWVAPIVPQGNVDPPVPPDPPVSDLEGRVAKIEDWLRSLGKVTTTGWPW